MLWKILRKNIKTGQLIATFLGVILGVTIIISAFSFYMDIKPIFHDKQSFWKDEYIIISKKISLGDTYNQINGNNKKPLFSDEEIENLKKQKFIKDVAQFTPCSFMVSAFTDMKSPIAGFYTDLFFEAIPDEYIDVNYKDWKWNENDKFIPVILPKAYLNLYNFGFAQSQNLPQISEEGAGMVKFNIIIEGNNKKQNFETRIVGFSERINTILVPKSFIDWANKNFGSEPHPKPGRLILIVRDPSSTELSQFIENNNYDLNKNELSNSKALAFLKVITGIVIIIGIIIIIFAFAMMIVSIQLLLTRNSENIQKLNLIGFSGKEIAKPYKKLISVLLMLSFLGAILMLIAFRKYYTANLLFFGYPINTKIFLNIILPSFAIILILVLCLCKQIQKIIKKIISQ